MPALLPGAARLPSLALAILVIAAVVVSGPAPAGEPDPVRGKYLFAAAGCAACHTDKKAKGASLAGGRKLKTPFGIFFSPNITPDPEYGIGKWSDRDFIRALRQGVAPDGRHYFPVFPYPSYTGITDRDLLDLKAYLFTRPPAKTANKPHDTAPPFGWRFLVPLWKSLYFTPGPFRADPGRSRQWNRGAYLVTALGHCSECHTPRDGLGGAKAGMALAGTTKGPEGGLIPNITPDKETGIGRWSDGDLHEILKTGMLPDGDFVGDVMGEVVDETTGRLKIADLKAIILYLRSLPPVFHRIERKKK